ncbi:hypothetical protein Ahy_B03g065958 [Arachis hypogaea]|uniref:MADS-box domain-containing protein n=1 Tax=Arachis hypogaea TaxID=3818 RepID=A0A445A2V5_ARAHY|nr:hypothetical protein Ahy_B03g065958 [Arachis hypogaea]
MQERKTHQGHVSGPSLFSYMGRGKTELKCLSTEKDRKDRFKTRMKGLESKMKKFSDKCQGSEACLIVYEEGSNAAPMIWPKDSTKVRSLIKKYEAQKNVRPPKIFDLQDFFEHKKTLVEAETLKARKCIYSVKYPTSDLNIHSLDFEQLRMFIGILDNKIGACAERINMLKNSQKVESNFNFGHNVDRYNSQIQPMMPLSYDMGSSSQMGLLSPNPMELMGSNYGLVNCANQFEDSVYSVIQNGALVNSTKVKEPEPMVHYDTNVMEDTTSKKDEEVRLVCTEKTIDKVNSTNQVSEALDWESQFAEAEAWASDFSEFENWMNQQSEHSDWTNLSEFVC